MIYSRFKYDHSAKNEMIKIDLIEELKYTWSLSTHLRNYR